MINCGICFEPLDLGSRGSFCSKCKTAALKVSIRNLNFGNHSLTLKTDAIGRKQWVRTGVEALANQSQVDDTRRSKRFLDGLISHSKENPKNPLVSIKSKDLWKKLKFQEWKCYWTGVPIQLGAPESRNLFKPSIDRLIPGGEYSYENTVISSMAANLGRQAANLFDTKLFFYALKTGNQFYREPPKGWALKLSCRPHSNNYSQKRKGKDLGPVQTSVEWIRDQYEIQNRKCFYSGLRMSSGLFAPSCDRIDSSIGYRTDNVVLCCRALNMAKSSTFLDHFNEWLSAVRTS